MAESGLGRLRALRDQEALASGDEEELAQALRAPADTWRLTAIQALVRHRSPAALPGAQRLLELDCETDPFLLGTLRLVLASAGEGDLRGLERRALGRKGLVGEGPWPVRPLAGRGVGLGWPLRRLAVQALGCLAGTDRAVLRRVIETDPDWAVREEAVYALGPPIDQEDEETLGKALDDARLPVRRAAAQLLEVRLNPLEGEGRYAWRAPGSEPYFRYFAGSSRRDYHEELAPGTRHGVGRNWSTFGIWCEIDMGEEPPGDVSSNWPLVKALEVDTALTQARDLVHHPGVVWGDDPLWPVCCQDYAVFYGHQVEATAPAAMDIDAWFTESLVPALPKPQAPWRELDAERYVFRCGYCGSWWTCYTL
ncbi:MAG: HEAT repeat domain-containing protein [Planctomycetota bacterium]